MAGERVQRQVDQLLDEAEEACVQEKWDLVLRRAKNALTFDPDDLDAFRSFLAVGCRHASKMAERTH